MGDLVFSAGDGLVGRELLGPFAENLRLARLLGRGGFGAVYLAEGTVSNSLFAVKLLPFGDIDEECRVALLNEVELATQVEHENVVRVFHVDRGTTVLGPYVIMEYVSGGTLADMLRKASERAEQIPIDTATRLMAEVARGAAAVNVRLIHRDIKPDNILSDGSHLKISDFGISKVRDAKTRTHTFKGGQHWMYMAPEGWRGEKNTEKLDIYSVGLVFYELLTLQHPLRSRVINLNEQREWERVHLYEPCPDPRQFRADIPTSVAQLIVRMVDKRPQDRPTWEEVLKRLSPDAGPTGPATAVAGVVEAAMRRKRQLEEATLKDEQKRDREKSRMHVYHYSCDTLMSRFRTVVDEFNSHFQFGAIGVERDSVGWAYKLPGGGYIRVSFFSPRETEIRISGGHLIGGGYLGINQGASCNLLLLRDSTDDLYGRWAACMVKFSAVVDPRDVASRIGMSLPPTQPFGLQNESLFYDHIRWATGGMHVFTYELRSDVQQLFVDMLETALAPTAGPPR